MLPKAQRVRRTTEFDGIFQNGRAVHGRLVTIRYAQSAGGPKVGFIVSSKTAGNAVSRNRLKRRLREAVRPHLSNLPDSVAIAVIAKPAAVSADSAGLAAEVSGLLKEATLVR